MRYYQWQEDKDQLMMIGKIICFARTYKDHAKEMAVELPREPVMFLKPPSSVIFSGESIVYPKQSKCVHHEVELGVVIGKRGHYIPINDVEQHIAGYCVALDITARDIQSEAKKKGLPWSIAKGFDTFTPISNIIIKKKIIDPHNLRLILKVNNTLRQQGNTSQLIWSIPKLISTISSVMTLEKGDLILTGTPKGVSEIQKGDVIEAYLESLCTLRVTVV